jgi:hypothetical protein
MSVGGLSLEDLSNGRRGQNSKVHLSNSQGFFNFVELQCDWIIVLTV